LCSCDGAGSPKLDAIPADLQKHVRQEDLDFLKQTHSTGIANGDGGTSTVESGVALHATCVVRAVDVQQTTALATLTRKSEDKVADYALSFVKMADGWKADYHLPEKEAARTSALRLSGEARDLVTQKFDWVEAKAKIVEARKLQPDDADLKLIEADIDKILANRVAGRWYKRVEKDPMTDKENVYVALAASNDFETDYGSKRPRLVGRCVKGEMDLQVEVYAVVGGNIWAPKAQYRFDTAPPQTMTMTNSEDHVALFFPEPTKWLDRLVVHPSSKLVIEIPLYGRIPQPATFDLTGADTAVSLVKSACGKK